MLISFCTSPSCPSSSSSSSAFLRLTNSNKPIIESLFRPKTHFSKPLSSSCSYSFSPLQPRFHIKGQSFNRCPLQRRLKFRTWALSGFDLSNFESILEAAGVLTAIIVVHESGHFLAAYLQGIHVSKFAVGFGPVLAKFNVKNVEYSIRAFPLGGFVGFPDKDPESDIPADDKNLLMNRPVLDRVIVISAGVIANAIFAYAIILFQVLSVGLPVEEAFPGVVVPEVRAFSAASRDGLFPGDVILSINGTELLKNGPTSVSKVVDVIKKNPKRNVLLKVMRGEHNFEIGVTPDENFDGTGKIGVQLSPNVKITKLVAKNILEAMNFAGIEYRRLSSSVLGSLKEIFMNFSKSASNIAGPVAIIAVGAEVARFNGEELYTFAALLNLNLAVINLLPLPALDGGSLALVLIEAARGGRKLPLELEERIMSSGFMLVLLLGLFLIVRDTLNLDFIKAML